MHSIDVTQTRGYDICHGPVLTLAERHARDDKIIAHIYRLQDATLDWSKRSN